MTTGGAEIGLRLVMHAPGFMALVLDSLITPEGCMSTTTLADVAGRCRKRDHNPGKHFSDTRQNSKGIHTATLVYSEAFSFSPYNGKRLRIKKKQRDPKGWGGGEVKQARNLKI